MKSKKSIYAHVDEQGRIVLPPEIVARYGLKKGDLVPVNPQEAAFVIRQPVGNLTRVYVEPTNACNLSCRTCIRHSWDELTGAMSNATFGRLSESLEAFCPAPDVVLGGFGEPLLHAGVADMVARIKKHAGTVELITNAMLLSNKLSRDLLAAGLDVLWVSLDGASPARYEGIRRGSDLDRVIRNVAAARDVFLPAKRHIGVVFVAMRSNITELPGIMRLGRRLGADRFLVTNVVPYAPEMCAELLYSDVQLVRDNLPPSVLAPHVQLPRMDMRDNTAAPLCRVTRGWRISNYALNAFDGRSDYCPFVERGAVALRWDGAVSPCLPLLHSHTEFLNDKRRFVGCCAFGNLNQESLERIWALPDYAAFRSSVQQFDFSSCTRCGGCHLSGDNAEDCFGNSFPVCGGCLWAQGIIRCP